MVTGYSYSQIEVFDKGVDSIGPRIGRSSDSFIDSAVGLVSGTQSPSSLLGGLEVQQKISVHNGGLVPVYLPSTRLLVYSGEISDSAYHRAQRKASMWLGPGGSRDIEVAAFIPTEEVPELVLETIRTAGEFNYSIDLVIEMVGVRVIPRLEMSVSIGNAIRERLGR